MAEVSRFLGIVIGVFFREHPPPHYHAVYNEFEVTVEIETGLVAGRFPRRALQHLLEWHEAHQQELLDNWKLCQEGKPPRRIRPLE
ncbi:MAG: DUF4160 domain-containing protein [Chloroflexi bacterium]|nr:DUF4160 domain-containing protein [Chloroflexota bacterium]